MKNIAISLLAALTLSTPAFASWKSDLFAKLDADKSGEIALTELPALPTNKLEPKSLEPIPTLPAK